MIYNIIKNKKLVVFCYIFLIVNTQTVNALLSNAKVKQLIDQEVEKQVQEKLNAQEGVNNQKIDKIKQESDNKIKEYEDKINKLQEEKEQLTKQIEESETNNTNEQLQKEYEDKIKLIEEENKTLKEQIQQNNSKVQSNNNTDNNDPVVSCATIDYNNSKIREQIVDSQKQLERIKNNSVIISANLDLEKSKSRNNSKREDIINNNSAASSTIDNNRSKERNRDIWYKVQIK